MPVDPHIGAMLAALAVHEGTPHHGSRSDSLISDTARHAPAVFGTGRLIGAGGPGRWREPRHAR
jgi:hypothetical protein